MNKISNVTVLGGGILGSQIAFHAAYRNFNVVIYDLSADLYNKIIAQFYLLKDFYIQEAHVSESDMEEVFNRISYSFDLKEAVEDADLVIEAIPENKEMKQELYQNLAQVAPQKTIFATNSSTMLPSSLAGYTGRPDKFLALHFANLLFRYNIVEVMGHPGTDQNIFRTVVDFSKELGMEPIEIKKEKNGYVLNSLLIPLLSAASELFITGVADIETIDKTWKMATGSPAGPFQIYDAIGLNTIYNIAQNGDVKSKLFAHFLKENYINKGKMGYLSGEGFYKYPPNNDINV